MPGGAAARTSWLVALKGVTSGRIHAPPEPPKPNWKKLTAQTAVSFLNVWLFCLAGATCLTFIEAEEMEEVSEMYYVTLAANASGTYLRFVGSLYVYCTTVTTVGYGDIVPYTSGGKWFVMVSCTAGFVVNLVCILRMAEIVNALMTAYARKLYKRRGSYPGWLIPVSLLGLLLALMLLNAITWTQLTRLNDVDSPFPPWSFTEACWFSWATFSTVGFGDLSPASSGQLNLPLLAAYVCVTLLGLALMTSLIEAMVEFVTDIRAGKEAAKLAQVAVLTSKKTYEGLKAAPRLAHRRLSVTFGSSHGYTPALQRFASSQSERSEKSLWSSAPIPTTIRGRDSDVEIKTAWA